MPDRATMIICTRGRGTKARCEFCTGLSEKLCDSPVIRNGKRGSCDKRLCKKCANSIGDNQDLCPPHFRVWEKNGRRFVL